jgi:hypothetical protein
LQLIINGSSEACPEKFRFLFKTHVLIRKINRLGFVFYRFKHVNNETYKSRLFKIQFHRKTSSQNENNFYRCFVEKQMFPILSLSDLLPVHLDVNVFLQNFIGKFRSSQRREYKMTSLASEYSNWQNEYFCKDIGNFGFVSGGKGG